jgi:uncharacterized membrane protein
LNKEFNPLDSFNVKVKVRNYDTENSRYVVVRAVLVKNGEIDDTEEKMTLKISKESSKTFTLNMSIPSDLQKGEYRLFVEAYDDDSSIDCDQRSIRFDVYRAEYDIAPINIELTSPVACEGTLNINGQIANLGNNDEDKVKIIYSDDLKFSDSLIIDSLNTGDSQDFSFNFIIPKNATEKNYRLTLRTYYDYNEDDDTYGESSTYNYYYNVLGGCYKETRNVSLQTLTQTAFLSEDTDVSVAITNSGNVQDVYTLTATSSDFLVKSISPSSITLSPGMTSYATVKVQPKADMALGMHTINVVISYSGKSETKIVSLNVQNASNAIKKWYDSVKDALSGSNTWFYAADAVLIIVIIFLIIKVFVFKSAAAAAPTVSRVFKSNIKKNFR